MNTWQRVGGISPRDLTETRLQLHWASQLAAAVGTKLVPAKPDDSHTALTSIPERSLLVTDETDTEPPRRVALALRELRLILLSEELEELDELPLDGKTIDNGLDWLRAKLANRDIALPSYDMPAHSIRDGEAFRRATSEGSDPFAELTAWFGNASHVLRDLDIGDAVCWPHHFDIATLVTLRDDKSIGVGLSPGDASYDEPYWYIAPWPHPEPGSLPELPSGHWHNEGFVAAVLTGSAITSVEDAPGQRARVGKFLEKTIAGLRELLS